MYMTTGVEGVTNIGLLSSLPIRQCFSHKSFISYAIIVTSFLFFKGGEWVKGFSEHRREVQLPFPFCSLSWRLGTAVVQRGQRLIQLSLIW